MKNNLTKKIILSIALTMIGTATSQSPHSPISMSSEAKAYNISESETNVNELTKYYTQRYSYHGLVIFKYSALKVGVILIN
ncbi:hypothetical protein U999_00292 [Staphylococcus aureus FP_N239]|nr:hypothetical protein U999_00292 [Staphylococcus aureus FP_N239]